MGADRREQMTRNYTVSKYKDSGLWYAHMKGYAYVPVFGSFGSKKKATEYAKMMDGLPHNLGDKSNE